MKKCSNCGAIFGRPYRLSFKQWEKRRFCSVSCRNMGHRPNYSFAKGHTPWNKGKSIYLGGKRFEKGHTPWNKDKPGVMPEPWNKGKRFDAIRGKNHWNWQGGKMKYNRFREMTYEENRKYLDWRKAVFERDNYTCKFCGQHGGTKHADHIKPWISFPELRFDINNGRTLCPPCHRKTNTYSRHKLSLTATEV